MMSKIDYTRQCSQCDGPHYCNGLCRPHYDKLMRHGILGGPTGRQGNGMKPGDPRIRRGSRHQRWRGDGVEYTGAHKRIYKARGLADHCIFGCTALQYQWANLTGNYPDPDDYAPMCGTCHNRYDQARKSMEPGFSTVCGWPVQIRSNARGNVPSDLGVRLAAVRTGR